MYRMCVLAFLALGISFVHSFTWEIVKGTQKQLNFYENGTVKYSKYYDSAKNIIAVAYDPVYNRVLFVDRNSSNTIIISSFDIETRKTESLAMNSGYVRSLAYDPVTETLFLNEGHKINRVSLKSKQAVKENIVSSRRMLYDIDVDSCGRYVYWNTLTMIERIRFDGSEREVIINNADTDRILNFIIDLQTQKIYWSEHKGEKYQIESADLNGINRRTILSGDYFQRSITVSKDFIYWKSGRTIWQLPKNELHCGRSVNVEPKLYLYENVNCPVCQDIAAKYAISEQNRGINNCEALKGISKKSVPIDSSSLNDSTADVSLHCDHSEESRTQGHNASICQNYCIQGDCIVSSEGPPKCRCNAGYSGQRCEINVCYDYCLHGNCSVGTEGQPECRCNAGYSGKRCEISACHGYCLNDGLCSLNEEDEPVCKCPAGYKGGRCDMFICMDYCLQGNCSVGTEGQPECRCNTGYSGKRCEVDVCHGYCLNNGLCSLNEEDEPVCQCTEDYEGGRCDVLSESISETAGKYCSHSQPEFSSFDDNGSSMAIERKKKEGDCCEILNQINTLL